MNTASVMKYGHRQFLSCLNKVTANLQDKPGAVGDWSPKDVVAHIHSYELVLSDVLKKAIDPEAPTPHIDRLTDANYNYNDDEVAKSKSQSYQEVLDAYTKTTESNLELVKQIPAKVLAEPGTIPWYGDEYCINDFIVYNNYGQKREHGAQIDMFVDHLAGSLGY